MTPAERRLPRGLARKPGTPEHSQSAEALRAAGFVPVPRWWVRPEDLELVKYMASKHADEVNEIRAEAQRRNNQRRARAFLASMEKGK